MHGLHHLSRVHHIIVCLSLSQVAGSPELYPLLVELNPIPTLLACLSHENTDIAGDAVELLMELTDAGVYVCVRSCFT